MKAIFKREFNAYFTSPIGYVFVGVFMLLSGIFFGITMFVQGYGNIDMVLPMCIMILVLITPIITMRLLAEERANKTDQLLLTSPVKVSGIVSGKFFAALMVFLIACATTMPYVVISAVYGDIVWGEVIATYMGFILMGALLLAIGIFISSLTESQIVAAVISYGVMLALFFSGMIQTRVDFIDKILKYFNISSWSSDFFRGVISPTGVCYYVTFTCLFLFLAVRKVESRRWR